LLEKLYPAVTAGFGYEIDVNEEATGIIIQISGFNKNLQVSIKRVLAKLPDENFSQNFLYNFSKFLYNFSEFFYNYITFSHFLN